MSKLVTVGKMVSNYGDYPE